MIKAIAFGLAAGAGFQTWRGLPPDGPVNPDGAYVFAVVLALAAFLSGLWFRRGSSATATASAVAEATSTASSQVQLAVVVEGGGAARMGAAGVRGPSSMPWVEGPAPALDASQLDGFDLSEFDHEGAESAQVDSG